MRPGQENVIKEIRQPGRLYGGRGSQDAGVGKNRLVRRKEKLRLQVAPPRVEGVPGPEL